MIMIYLYHNFVILLQGQSHGSNKIVTVPISGHYPVTVKLHIVITYFVIKISLSASPIKDRIFITVKDRLVIVCPCPLGYSRLQLFEFPLFCPESVPYTFNHY